jgi:hypothetical protein
VRAARQVMQRGREAPRRPHRVWHLALEELLGVQAEALARAGAPRTACTLRGLHPAHTGPRREEEGGERGGSKGVQWCVTQPQHWLRRAHPRGGCRCAGPCCRQCALTWGSLLWLPGWLRSPADGRDPQGVHAGARVVLFLLHHAAVNHVHHAIHWGLSVGGGRG